MTVYRILRLTPDRRVGGFDTFDSVDDIAAVALARKMEPRLPFELWEDGRRVAVLGSDPKNS